MSEYFSPTRVTEKQARDYLQDKNIFSRFSIKPLNSGFSNRNFLILSGDKKFTFRTNQRRPPMNKETLRNEHLILDFLTLQKSNFSARSFFFDPVENVHIIRYIEGRKIEMRNLKEKNLKKVLQDLYKVDCLAGEFKKFLKKKKVKFKPAQKYNKNLKKIIIPQIRKLNKHNEYREFLIWAKEKINQDLKKIRYPEKEIFLNHGDPVSNIVIQKDRVYLIDWEQIKFAYDPGLAYIFLHGHLEDWQREKVLEIYSRISGCDFSELKINTYHLLKQLLIQNIVDVCAIHRRNIELYDSKKKIDKDLLQGRMRYYDYIDSII